MAFNVGGLAGLSLPDTNTQRHKWTQTHTERERHTNSNTVIRIFMCADAKSKKSHIIGVTTGC